MFIYENLFFFFCYYKFLLFEGLFSLLVYLYYKKEWCEVNDLKLVFFYEVVGCCGGCGFNVVCNRKCYVCVCVKGIGFNLVIGCKLCG